MRPSTTNTITTNRATKITAHCKLTLIRISYSNPNSLGTRANEPRCSLSQLRKQAQTLKATTKGVRHSNYAEPGHYAQSHRPSMTPNHRAKDIHKYARNIVASSYFYINHLALRAPTFLFLTGRTWIYNTLPLRTADIRQPSSSLAPNALNRRQQHQGI